MFLIKKKSYCDHKCYDCTYGLFYEEIMGVTTELLLGYFIIQSVCKSYTELEYPIQNYAIYAI